MIFQTSMIMFHVNHPGCSPFLRNSDLQNDMYKNYIFHPDRSVGMNHVPYFCEILIGKIVYNNPDRSLHDITLPENNVAPWNWWSEDECSFFFKGQPVSFTEGK